MAVFSARIHGALYTRAYLLSERILIVERKSRSRIVGNIALFKMYTKLK